MLPVNETFYKDYFEEAVSSETIFLLSDEEAVEIWEREIGLGSKSYFDLPDDNWLIAGEQKQVGEWRTAYNENNIKLVSDILKLHQNWSDETTIFFLINRKNIFQLDWHNFILNWDCFLSIEDDCSVVIPRVNLLREAILFQHLGGVYAIGGYSDTDKLSAADMVFDEGIMASA